MWPDDRLTSLLGIRHPIIQAPMAGSTTPELMAAVSNAGALGSFGLGTATAEAVADVTARTHALTNRPFNLNFFAYKPPRADAGAVHGATHQAIQRMTPHFEALGVTPPALSSPGDDPVGPAFVDAVLEQLLLSPPAIVSFHFGVPEANALARLKAVGCRILCSATRVSEARALEAAGVDAIIAQGWEAGGHRGAFEVEPVDTGVGLFSLLPQIVDAVSVPVIAAGGIADGRGIAAAFALGASGVQIGTAFLSTPEAATPEGHRAAIATSSDDETRLTRAFSGRPARARRSVYIDDMAGIGDLPECPQMYPLSNPLKAAARAAGSDEYEFLLYGQSAPMNRPMPAGELVETLVAEAASAMGARTDA